MDQEINLTKTAAEQTPTAEQTRCGYCYRPNVDIVEQADELLVLADVPGAKSEAIDVDFEDGMLEIRAPVAIPECKNGTCLSHEYGIGDYYRSFRVTEAIDATKISAEYADGVLTLHLPKAEAIKPRKIAVSAK